MVHGSSGTTAGDRIWNGTSSVVSALAKEEDCSSSEGTVVSSGDAGGDNRRLAVLGRQEPQELKVKALRPCLGKLVGLGGWTLQRRDAQGSTQII